MINVTTERVVGVSIDPPDFRSYCEVEAVELPEEPLDFQEFMDQDREIDFLFNRLESFDVIERLTT